MDITHHKFTNTPNWEPYNIPMNQEQFLQNQNPFDRTQWPYNYLPNDLSNPSPNLPILDFKPEDQIQDLQEPQEEEGGEEEEEEELGAMKEMMFKIAAMQPVDIDPATIRKPRRRNVRISDDPQSVAARHRRERISEKIRILQRLVPGGTKMDTASMLDEAIRYVKFLKRQIRILQGNHHPQPPCVGIPTTNVEDWAVVTTAAASTAAGTSYLFGNDGATGDDISYSPMCFNNKFIGD